MNRIVIALVALAAASLALPALAPAHSGHSHQPQAKGKSKKHKKGKKHQGKRGKAQSSRHQTRTVAISFAAVNGSKPVSCGKPITDLGTTSRTAALTDLRFYVSDLQLLRKGGGAANVELRNSKWSYTEGKAAVTLVDLENGTGGCAAEGTKAVNAQVRGTVPRGAYTGVRYSVSVPDSLSHTDLTAMPSPLNIAAMGWSWQFGRKFVKVEVSEAGGPAWDAKTFFVHLGSTDCKGDPAAGEKARCALPNRDRITLKRFNPAKQRIAIDLEKLFGDVDVASNGGSGGSMGAMGSMEGMDMSGTPGCMSETTDLDCPPIFKALGLKLGTGKTTSQTAFRVVGR